MRILWITDTHFDHLDENIKEDYMKEILSHNPDCLFITGDISNSRTISSNLKSISKYFNIPIYFTLGNHDYYFSSFKGVDKQVNNLCQKHQNLHFMDSVVLKELTGDTCVIGHTGCNDGGFGNFLDSNVMLSDYMFINNLAGLYKCDLLDKLEKRSRQAVDHIKHSLSVAFGSYSKVFLLTHVPPWKEISTYQGVVSDNSWLPHFSCKMMGIAIEEFMKDCNGKLTVLCGHTHDTIEMDISHNIHVCVSGAEYGFTRIAKIIEIED